MYFFYMICIGHCDGNQQAKSALSLVVALPGLNQCCITVSEPLNESLKLCVDLKPLYFETNNIIVFIRDKAQCFSLLSAMILQPAYADLSSYCIKNKTSLICYYA
ncbi:hypothetical protein FKM82_014523 [Ascaphus truei]